MKEKFYITTAIAYTSKKPHIGNTYEAVLTDAIARYKRLRGYDVFFLTGTDEHGLKIQQEADAAGITPQQYVDKVAGEIKDIWSMFNISYDKFIRTTDEEHVRCVQKIFNKLYEQGDIYKGTYEGNYCTPCESSWTDSQLKDGCCPDCGRECKKVSEEAYFLRCSKYVDRLMDYYDSHDDFITPVSRKNEMVNNFIKPGLQNLCITRTSFSWGVPVDFDPKHVIYVWIDALLNYITAIGYDPDGNNDELFNNLWPAELQVIGKDIIRFHTIYWPIILMALDLPLPQKVLGHPWLLSGEDKMSKSKGNVIYGDDLINEFGLDPVRHYLLAEMGYFNDGSITYENLIKRTNSDLANTLGNLVSRTGAMIKQYFGGIIPKNSGNDDEFAVTLKNAISEGIKDTTEKYDKYFIADADAAIFNTLKACNKYIDETTPWVLAKDPEKKQALADVLSNLVESIRICNVFIEPLMPDTAKKINEIFKVPELDFESACEYKYCCEGIELGEVPILFARIDEKKYFAELEKKAKEAKKAQKEAKKAEKKEENTIAPEIIGIEDFAKIDLRVGLIKECVKAENSDKLLVLQIDMGSEIRQVVSGIAKYYAPDALIGKKVIVVSNLKPAKLRGIDSNGMILAADTENGVKVIFADDNASLGSKVR